MEGFDHILNWKLRAGSHPFPGKDGGTCINEAALVAAGFTYRPIRSVLDMPSCFSRPICSLAMSLNDEASDADRQRLMPFVTRLACADSPAVERRRAAYIDAQFGFSGLYPLKTRFEMGLKALEGALAIGRRADAVELGEMRDRMEAARTLSEKPSQQKTGLLPAKLKSWFGATGKPECVE
jgi:hypothetical protein